MVFRRIGTTSVRERSPGDPFLLAFDSHDDTATKRIYGPTALRPEDEPATCPIIPLDTVKLDARITSTT